MAPAAEIDVLPGLVVQPPTEGPSGPHIGAVTSCPCAHRWGYDVSNRSASKWTVPVASTWIVDVPREMDTHGGSLPPPPPAGAGSSAIPAPKMFEVPGTSTVTADPHGSIRPCAALVLAGGSVAGATGSPPAAVQPAVSRHTIPRAARGRRISDHSPGPRMFSSRWRTGRQAMTTRDGAQCRASPIRQ